MTVSRPRFHPLAAGLVAAVLLAGPGGAVAETLDQMFARLQEPGADTGALVALIEAEWSKSGSASMDLLLERGRKAMAAEDWQTAIGFLTALVDHAPGFAEGFAARAGAYYNAGLVGPAIADLQRALALNPSHFEAMEGFATILEDLGRPAEALEVWREVARLTPGAASVKGALARLDRETLGEPL